MNCSGKIKAIEKKQEIISRQNHYCAVCGNYLYNPQLAHRIPKTKPMLKLYGAEIIHHPFNLVAVCSLECNSSVLINPNTQLLKADRLIKKIKEDLCKKK